MSDAAGAVATGPATPPAAAPAANGAGGSATPAPAQGGGSAARGPDGKFLSATSTPAPKPEAPPSSAYKFDLGEGEREYSPEQLRAWALKGRSADKLLSKAEHRAREAAQREQGHQAMVRAIKSRDVGAFMDAAGVSEEEALQFFETGLLPAIERQQMSPEQRAAHEAKQETQQLRKELERRQQAEQRAAFESEVAARMERMRGPLAKAVRALNVDESVIGPLIARVADRIDQLWDDNDPPSEAEIAQLVWDEHVSGGKAIAGGMSFPKLRDTYGLSPATLFPEGSSVSEALGPEIMLRVRKEEFLRLKSRGQSVAAPPRPALEPKTTTSSGYKTAEEVRKLNRYVMGD